MGSGYAIYLLIRNSNYDDDGDFWIVGCGPTERTYQSQGTSSGTSESEDLFWQHEDMADVAVASVPDDECGEVPRAYVVRRCNAAIHGEQNYLASGLAEFKQLAGGVEFVRVTLNAPSGKITRRELVRMFTAKRNSFGRNEYSGISKLLAVE